MNISYGQTFIDRKKTQFIPVDQTQMEPNVIISQTDYNFSSLFMYDPNAVKGIFIHWLVINIPKNSFITAGEIKKKYYPPSPPARSGDHQYIFQLYGHNTELTIPDKIVDDYSSVSKNLSEQATLLQTLSFTSRNKDEKQALGLASIEGGKKNKKLKSRRRSRRRIKNKTKKSRNRARKIIRGRSRRNKK